jgi:hypothetical protein
MLHPDFRPTVQDPTLGSHLRLPACYTSFDTAVGPMTDMKHDCPVGGDLENTCEKTAPAPRPSVELLSMPLAFLATAQYWKLHPPPPTWDTGSRHPARRDKVEAHGPWSPCPWLLEVWLPPRSTSGVELWAARPSC